MSPRSPGEAEPQPVGAAQPRLSRLERAVIALVFFCLLVPFAYFKCVRWIEGFSDNAQFAQILESTLKSGVPRNYIFPSIDAYFKRGLPTLPPQQACQADLSAPAKKSDNFLQRHGYFIIYVLAPLALLIPAPVLWPIMTTLSFLALILIAYLFLRRHGVSPVSSAVFCAGVSLHPAWSQGFLFGQIYPDRLFVGLAAGLIFVVTSFRPRRLPIAALAVLSAALAAERTAGVVGVFLILFVLLYPKSVFGHRLFLLALGAAFLVMSFVTFRLLTNADYGTFMPHSAGELVSRFSIPGFAEGTAVFLLANLGFLGLLALFEPRALGIAFVMMIPNVVGIIGGAEKTGWSTHYHTLYLPFLVWAAACGYVRLLRRTASPVQVYVLEAVVVVFAFLAGGLFPYLSDRPRQSMTRNLASNAWPRVFGLLPSYFPEAQRRRMQVTFDELRRRIPLRAVVTAAEFAHPSLYKGRTVYLYPIGLRTADYAIPGAVSYLGEANEKQLNQCLLVKLRDAGYDMDHPIWVGQFPVYRRSSGSSATQQIARDSAGH